MYSHFDIDYGGTIVNTYVVVETRTYRSVNRAEQARQTHAAVLSAGHELFSRDGYAGTTMRRVAASAGVSVPTVEQLFGTKSTLLKACIDVAIAGDSEPVTMLERDWTRRAEAATDLGGFVAVFASVLAPAQSRSAALVLAVFEGSRRDPELAELADRLTEQRAVMATWLIDQLRRRQPLRTGLIEQEAIDTVWVLLDPAVYQRLTLHRGHSIEYYERWIAESITRLLFDQKPQHNVTRRQQ
jgi:AcrR family transcriptional regulator